METQLQLTNDKEFSWHNYNESQTKEKDLFINMLVDLCYLLEEPKNNSVGRKPAKTRNIIFAIVMKQYLNISARRIQSDLKLFKKAGFIDSNIPFNTLLDHFERIELKEILKELIEISSLPLKKIERDFAIDATCFSTPRYTTYFDVRWGRKKDSKQRKWRKCHAVCGVKTNIITSVDITEGNVHDNKLFEPLAKDTARNFKIREFSGDKGYLAGQNFAIIKDLGGQAFLPFKKNTTASSNSQSKYRSYFKQAHRFFKENREEYLNHYHKRSNIESSFSMIKRKFGNNLKFKKEISQDNEILAKVLSHNICVLVQEIFLNDVNINFNICQKQYIARD